MSTSWGSTCGFKNGYARLLCMAFGHGDFGQGSGTSSMASLGRRLVALLFDLRVNELMAGVVA